MPGSKESNNKAEGSVTTEPMVTSVSAQDITAKKLVVCAYPGTGDQLAKVWEKMAGEDPFILTVDKDRDILDIIAEVIAATEIDRDFILVPANCIPCAPISLSELAGPFVFVDINGRRHFNNRLPIPMSKDKLVDALVSSEGINGEAFLEAYFKRNLHRPIEGGFRFGNLVTPVLRADPCENLVIEAFVRKKFVTATPEGYKAISHLVDQYLLG